MFFWWYIIFITCDDPCACAEIVTAQFFLLSSAALDLMPAAVGIS